MTEFEYSKSDVVKYAKKASTEIVDLCNAITNNYFVSFVEHSLKNQMSDINELDKQKFLDTIFRFITDIKNQLDSVKDNIENQKTEEFNFEYNDDEVKTTESEAVEVNTESH